MNHDYGYRFGNALHAEFLDDGLAVILDGLHRLVHERRRLPDIQTVHGIVHHQSFLFGQYVAGIFLSLPEAGVEYPLFIQPDIFDYKIIPLLVDIREKHA